MNQSIPKKNKKNKKNKETKGEGTFTFSKTKIIYTIILFIYLFSKNPLNELLPKTVALNFAASLLNSPQPA